MAATIRVSEKVWEGLRRESYIRRKSYSRVLEEELLKGTPGVEKIPEKKTEESVPGLLPDRQAMKSFWKQSYGGTPKKGAKQ